MSKTDKILDTSSPSLGMTIHSLVRELSLNPDNPYFHEAIVEIRNTRLGDAVGFDFHGTPYTINGQHIYKDGTNSGIVVAVSKSIQGHTVHLTGTASDGLYTDVIKSLALHNGNDDHAAHHVELTVTDEDGLSTTLSSLHEAQAGFASTDSFSSPALAAAVPHSAMEQRLDISDILSHSAYKPGLSHIDDYVKVNHVGQVFVDPSGNGHFDATHPITIINNINTLYTINVVLHHDEGSKILHTI